jgi:hypothetical protein
LQTIIGTLTFQEAAIISDVGKATKDIPILSLISPAFVPPVIPLQPPFFLQMATDANLHMKCIAAIVGHFNWRKVTTIYENNNLGTLTLLSDSLQAVGSKIEHHSTLPSLSSLSSDPKPAIEEELKKLRRNSNRVFVVVLSSLELAILLFQKANQMGMMEKGYVWIVTDEIASLLDSVDSSITFNMQGVLGFKTSFESSSENFKQFKIKFRKKYGSKYPEEENANPSIFALRAYDATWAIAQAVKISQGRFWEKILSTNFEGLSGKISFKNSTLSKLPIFEIINVVGKSYKEVEFWSPEFGFSEDFTEHDGEKVRVFNGSINGVMGQVLFWPGGLQAMPKGWTYDAEEKPLKIGVPARGAFNQFVRLNYDNETNRTLISGFSIDVFKAVVERLPYKLPHVFVPFNGSYDEMVQQVHSKVVLRPLFGLIVWICDFKT